MVETSTNMAVSRVTVDLIVTIAQVVRTRDLEGTACAVEVRKHDSIPQFESGRIAIEF